MKYILVLIILIFVTAINSHSQKLHLKISDPTHGLIELSYLKIYCDSNNNRISYYNTIRNGIFVIDSIDNCHKLKIEISSPGYEDYHNEIKLNKYVNDTLICVLTKINVKDLTPIVVTSKSRPIQIKKDTTIYKVKAFTDGTEQKLSDVLEKLPGIEINKKNGEIKFKGKPIETILLEGDNLFGANYTLGSKNINANIVSEVQAIENYSENYVLKGLEKEERVAINIKLAKTSNKLNVSGNNEIGVGMSASNNIASDINSNLIGIGQIHKFFSTVSYNNIGHNNSPVDYFGNNYSIEQIKDKKYTAQKFIQEPSFAQDNGKSYSNINSQFFGNYNALFKLTSKISLKSNLYYLNDKIANQQNFNNQYFVTNDTIVTKDIIICKKKPQALKGDVRLRYAISSKALIEAVFTDAKDEIQSYKNSTSNNTIFYQTNLNTDNRFNKFLVTYTQRINKSQALQIELRKNYSSIEQVYNIFPSVFKRSVFFQDRQLSSFERKYIYATASFFGKLKKVKYNFTLKGVSDNNNYLSSISNINNNVSLISNINKIKYIKNSFVQTGNLNFDFGKLKLLTIYNFTYLQQQWLNKSIGNKLGKESFFFEPTIKCRYLLTNISSLSLTYSYNFTNANDQYLFPEIIIQNFRNITNNKIALSLTKSNLITLNYSRSDLFNQFDNGIAVTLQTNGKDYLPIYNITDTLLYTTFSLGDVSNTLFDIYLYLNKYIPSIKSSLKFSLNNSTYYYYNFLTPGLLRKNINNFTATTLFFKTIFKGKFNFETENTFAINNSKNTFVKPISIHSYVSNAKLIFIPQQNIKMFIVGDFYLPNLNSNKGTLFLNYNFSYRPNKKKMEIKLIANNLTNTLSFVQYQVSDFSRSILKTNTLSRNFLLYLSIQF